jgi:hypothetical protein
MNEKERFCNDADSAKVLAQSKMRYRDNPEWYMGNNLERRFKLFKFTCKKEESLIAPSRYSNRVTLYNRCTAVSRQLERRPLTSTEY